MQSASAPLVAWSPIIATHGSPGSTRIAKKTMLIAPSSMGIATMRRRAMYWSMALCAWPAQFSTFRSSG